jgi:hypothetical protein
MWLAKGTNTMKKSPSLNFGYTLYIQEEKMQDNYVLWGESKTIKTGISLKERVQDNM